MNDDLKALMHDALASYTAAGVDGSEGARAMKEGLARIEALEAEADKERVRSHREGYSQGKSAGDAFAESIRQHVLK